MNLQGFLPQVEGVTKQVQMSLQNGKLVQTIENKEIKNIDEWVLAYTHLYGENHPDQFPALLVYMKI